MYTWLFTLLLDRTATRAERDRAREIMANLGLPISVRRRAITDTRIRSSSTFSELIRAALTERIHGHAR